MKLKRFRNILGATAVLGGTIASFIFFEAIIIGLAAFAGFWGASFILSAIFIVLTLGVVWFYDYGQKEQEYKLAVWLRELLVKVENKRPRTSRLVKKSLPFGFLVSTEVFGPVITTIIIKATTDTNKKRLRILAIISSFIFSFTWVAIYSGAIYGIKKLF